MQWVPTSIEMIPPGDSAGAGDRITDGRQIGRRKVQSAANVPVDVNAGNIGEIAMETIDSS